MSLSGRVTLESLRKEPLPKPDSASDKSARGRVLVIAGSVEVPGAALLAAVAALRAGCGRLQIATCASVAPGLALQVPEALVVGLHETPAGGVRREAAEQIAGRLEHCDAVLVGPGMQDDEDLASFVAGLMESKAGPAFVIDAGALTGMGSRMEAFRAHAGRIVLTPHAGEMAALLGVEREAVEADPLAAARQAARISQGVVVMKGPRTQVVSPQGETWACDHGDVGLATSGSGDVLAGIIAGLLARGATPVQAARWGVYCHAEAGARLALEVGPIGFLARELLAEIPRVLRDAAA